MSSASPTGLKRKLPQDFFKRGAQRAPFVPTKSVRAANCKGNTGKRTDKQTVSTDATQVPGLIIVPDIISETQERELLDFLDSRQWRTDLSRRTMHFGGNYCLYKKTIPGQPSAAPEIIEAPPMPQELEWLVQLFVDHGIYESIDHKRPEYVIVNEYRSKMGISAHTENFSFHSPVLGLSLGSADTMRFHELSAAFDGSVRTGKAAKAPRTGRVVDVSLPGRSLCIMSDDARWKWQHEIRSIKRPDDFRRVSLTFRVKK